MRKSWLILIILVALLGAVTAGYSLKLFYQIQSVGFDKPAFCNLSPTMNCEVVQASSFAEFMGLPISGLGLCYYVFTILLALVVWLVPTAAVPSAQFGWVVGFGTFMYSATLAWISATILRVWCPTCIVMYGINLVIWFAWWIAGRVHPVYVWRHLTSLWKPAAGLAVVFAVGAVFMLSQKQSMGHVTERQMQDALYAFDKGSTHILPTDWTDHPVWGNPDAKVTIVEFSDLECPFCRMAALNLLPRLTEYRNDVKLVFVNYPLDQSCNKNMQMPGHKNSCMAATATMCAYKQHEFWDYSEDVFRDQRRISREMLLKLADKHGLDMPQFIQCLDNQESMPLVQRDITIGEGAMISATPTVFINGKPFPFWRSPEVTRAVLKRAIGK